MLFLGVQTRSNKRLDNDETNSSNVVMQSDDFTPADFKILKVLGKGGFGKVFQVRKVRDGSGDSQLFAMKVLRKSSVLSSYGNATHVIHERNVLASTKCPFLCTLHFAFHTDEKLYLVMEYMNGGDLFGYLERQTTISEADARFYLSEIILALEYLHDQNIIYRDLKADNIMLSSTGHVKLTDFGLCKKGMRSGVKTYTRCGTNEYMAPEVLSRNGYGKEADIWSFGILLFDMLAGGPPFNGNTKKETYEAILRGKLVMPTHFSIEIRNLLKKILVRRVERRFRLYDIKRHNFFKKVNWNQVKYMEIKPPFVPMFRHPEDVSLFSNEFTSMTPQDSPLKTMGVLSTDDIFAGFEYPGPGQSNRMEMPSKAAVATVVRRLNPSTSTSDEDECEDERGDNTYGDLNVIE